MDTTVLEKLLDILEKETSIYEGILNLSKNKTDVIVEGKVSDLESIVRAEQSMIMRISKLESKREEIVDLLAEQLNVKASDITISGLKKMLPAEHLARLKEYQDKLSSLFSELRKTNNLNSKLIKNSLEYIDFSLNVLANTGPAGNNYGSTGQSSESKIKNFFDMRL